MKPSTVIPFLLVLQILLDVYIWQAIKIILKNKNKTLKILTWVYWGISIIAFLGAVVYLFGAVENRKTYFLLVAFISIVSKIFGSIFLLIDDIRRFILWMYSKIGVKITPINEGVKISRTQFLSQAALTLTAIPALNLSWGVISGAHDYRIKNVKIKLKNLPKAFDGMRIIQISDIHSGSFFNKTAVIGGVEMILNQKPDLVFFTGDLVNNQSSEMKNYQSIFSKIKAPLGVYSVLGNHDYGDYVRWNSEQEKKENINTLAKIHSQMGWRLLRDEHLYIEQNKEKLALIGVENISGNSRFHTYGNLKKAVQGIENETTKILLSHDPTHWDKEVNQHYKNIDLMLSGHTHGTQLGISVGDHIWSPAQYVYKQWKGLYHLDNQQLYVNVGFGYLGYPGRIGMPPEITLIELKSA